jgi:hypothetical protein
MHSVEEHRRAGEGEEGVHPVAPLVGEAASTRDTAQARPGDGVESLGEIQLEDDAGARRRKQVCTSSVA